MLGKTVNIMGIPYSVRKCKNQADVDTVSNNSLCGQVNFEDRTISIYVGGKETPEDIEDTVLHEVIHAIINHLFRRREGCEVLFDDSFIEPFTSALRDTLVRNNLCKFTII